MYMSTALQDDLLDEMIAGEIPVIAYLMSGFQIRGTILNHDDAVIVFDVDNRHQIVYKHALSNILPQRKLKAVENG